MLIANISSRRLLENLRILERDYGRLCFRFLFFFPLFGQLAQQVLQHLLVTFANFAEFYAQSYFSRVPDLSLHA